jgi:glycerophosphoryl diester phosphodiesterase
MERKPLVLAHRGSHALLPENTPAAFAAAFDLGADGIEFDVHKSATGAYVVVHDPPVAGTSYPLLAAVLAGLPRDRVLDVELKGGTLTPADCPRLLAEIVAARIPVGRLLVTSFDPSLLPPWRAWGIAAGLLIGNEAATMGVRRLVRLVRGLRPDWLCVPVQAFAALGRRKAGFLLRIARLAGLRLAFWTVDARADLAGVCGIADAIITNDVQTTLAFLGRAP